MGAGGRHAEATVESVTLERPVYAALVTTERGPPSMGALDRPLPGQAHAAASRSQPAQRPAMELDSSCCFSCTTCPCQSAHVSMAPACMMLSQC